VPPFARAEPEPSPISHRTTARGLFLTLLLGLTAGSAAAFPPELPPAPTKPAQAAPKFVFPVLGPARYISDFGAPRHQGRHEGTDIMSVRWAPALAVESGEVEFKSGGWGCMLDLYGDSGTKYVYIHLNNDLTMKNDNRGRCVAGVAFAKGLKSGQRVEAGQHIAYVGDSGDADGIQPHLHFERHPGGGAAANPYRWLNRVPRLLYTAPANTQVSLALRATVVSTTLPDKLRVRIQTARPYPNGIRVNHDGRGATVSVPETAVFETRAGFLALPDLQLLKRGDPLVVWTAPALSTLGSQLGRGLVVERVQLLPPPPVKKA
jgi:Peptidase family M23